MSPYWLLMLPLGLITAVMVGGIVSEHRAITGERNKPVQSGAAADAEIIGYRRHSDAYWVIYPFTPRGPDRPVRCEKTIRGRAQRFPAGTIVPVRYNLKYPTISLLRRYATHQHAF